MTFGPPLDPPDAVECEYHDWEQTDDESECPDCEAAEDDYNEMRAEDRRHGID
jgi:rubredoxin